MKRWIMYDSIYNNSTLLELEVDVNLYDESSEIASSTKFYDSMDTAFYSFEEDLLNACEIHEFELEDCYSSNNPNSDSLYYILTKTNEEGTKLKIFLKIRISDHTVSDRPGSKYVDRDAKYVKDQAQKLAMERYNQKRGWRARRIDIVFDDDHYTSYEQALRAIENRLDEFDPE